MKTKKVKEVIKLFDDAASYVIYTKGDHRQYKKKKKKGKVTVNKKLSDDLDDFYLSSIFKQAGWK